jgi:hypothetical protein
MDPFVYYQPHKSRLDFVLQRRIQRRELLTCVAILSAPHLRAKDVREPPCRDAVWHRNKREAIFHRALCRERRISRQSARRCGRHQRRRLFQLHKQQNKNRPHPHGHRKLRQGRVAHRTSSGKRKRQKEHNQCREYPNHQLAFPVHGRSPSTCAVAHIVPQAQPHVSARVYPEGPAARRMAGRACVFRTSGDWRNSIHF